MNINALATQLLTHFAPEERSIPDATSPTAYPGRNAAVALAMNAALQELFGEGSPWVRYDEIGYLVNAPTTVTIAVTNGDTAATITGWQSWMAGCTIAIEGSDVDNQIRNASASAVLKFPYDGTTGTKSATVYHDSITVGASVMEILKPVKFNRTYISPVPAGGAPVNQRVDEDYGFEHRTVDAVEAERVGNRLGPVTAYAVETWNSADTSGPTIRIRLMPATDQGGTFEHRAIMAPPVVVSDLSSTDTLAIPLQYVQSIFYPVARKHLTGSAFWRHGPDPNEIERSYQKALELLRGLAPRTDDGIKRRPVY